MINNTVRQHSTFTLETLSDKAEFTVVKTFGNHKEHLCRILPYRHDSDHQSEHVTPYNDLMSATIPAELKNQKYLSLATFRKSGGTVRTPVWFAEENGKLYIFTNPDSGKIRRLRNNPAVTVAPCTIRGRITGSEFSARAHILPQEAWPAARKPLEKKYWLMRVPFLWSKNSVFIEIELAEI